MLLSVCVMVPCPVVPERRDQGRGRAETFDAAPAAGILVCFSAEREPVLIAALALLAVVITATFLARGRPLAFSSVGRHPRWWPALPPAVARRWHGATV